MFRAAPALLRSPVFLAAAFRGYSAFRGYPTLRDFPRGLSGKEPTCWCRRCKRCGFDSWVGKIPWRGEWQPTLVHLPGESHGQRNLVGYIVHGVTESQTGLKCAPVNALEACFLSTGSFSYLLYCFTAGSDCHCALLPFCKESPGASLTGISVLSAWEAGHPLLSFIHFIPSFLHSPPDRRLATQLPSHQEAITPLWSVFIPIQRPWSSQLSEKQFPQSGSPCIIWTISKVFQPIGKINDSMENEEKGILYKSSHSHHPKCFLIKGKKNPQACGSMVIWYRKPQS